MYVLYARNLCNILSASEVGGVGGEVMSSSQESSISCVNEGPWIGLSLLTIYMYVVSLIVT